jgi:hypothetical protein
VSRQECSNGQYAEGVRALLVYRDGRRRATERADPTTRAVRLAEVVRVGHNTRAVYRVFRRREQPADGVPIFEEVDDPPHPA